MERTRVRIIESHTAAAARRTDVLMLATLSLFCWIAFLVVWVLIHTLTRGVWNVLGINLASLPVWSLISMLLNWITAGTAAVMLGHRGNVRRLYEPLS